MDTLDKIQNLIADKGWSNNEFLRRIGLSSSTIASWRAGKSSPDKHLPKIAAVLGTTEEYLRGETDDPTPKEIPPDDPAAVEGRKLLRKMGVQREDGSIDYEKLEKLDEFITLNKHLVLGKGDNGK